MSSRLDDRIRTMMQTVVDESPPPPEIPVRPPAPVLPRRVPNWAAAVGAAVAVLVLIGGVTLLLGGPSTNEVIEEPMPTVATTTPTTVPDGTPTTDPDSTPSTVPGTTIPTTPIPDLSASGLLASSFINEASDLALAPDGAIWAATRSGVVRWDTGASIPVVYGEEDGLPAAAVDQIVVAADGTVWAFGDGWVAYYDGTWQLVETHSDMWFDALAADTTGGVWVIGIDDNRFLHINRDGTEQISIPESWDSFDAIAVDDADRLWMVSGDGDDGVVVYNGSSWREYTTADGLPGHVLSDVDVAPDGTVWISTEAVDHGVPDPGEDPNVAAAGIASFDGEAWTTYTTADGLASNEGEIAIAPDGTVWVIHPDRTSPWGAVSAASRRDGDTWTVLDVEGSWWRGAVGGSNGTLWLGTNSGVVHFDGTTTTRYVVPDEMAPAAVPLALEPTTSAAKPVDAGPFGEITWQTYDGPAGHSLGDGIATPHGFVANGDVSSMTSPDGVNWVTFKPPLKALNFAVSGDDLYALGDRDVVRLAWTGTTWRAADLLEIDGLESDQWIQQMAFGDGGIVMTTETQILFSTDGHTFAPARQGPDPALLRGAGNSGECQPSFGGGGARIGPVVATESGFVALTAGNSGGWDDFPLCEPVVWTSSDGSTWDLDSAESPFGPTAYVYDMAERDGRFVAVGGQGARFSGATLWVSEDGVTWNEIPPGHIDGSIVDYPVSIGTGEAGWVVLHGHALMYSLDGLDWVAPDGPPEIRWGYAVPGLAVGTDRILVAYDVTRIGEITR
jgi:sugar lactone lactonase YvrE